MVAAEKYRFYRIALKYILVLSDVEVPNALELKGNQFELLTQDEVKWLENCFREIFEEILQQKEAESKRAQAEFLEELIVQLEKEKEKLNG